MPYGIVVSRTLIARSSTPRSPAQRALDPLARLIISRESANGSSKHTESSSGMNNHLTPSTK